MRAQTYGLHLILRLSDIELNEGLDRPDMIAGYLSTLVERIGIRILAGPLVGQESGPAEREGYSGVVILYESHVRHPYLSVLAGGLYRRVLLSPVRRPHHPVYNWRIFGGFEITEQGVFDRGSMGSRHPERDGSVVKRTIIVCRRGTAHERRVALRKAGSQTETIEQHNSDMVQHRFPLYVPQGFGENQPVSWGDQ